MGGSGDEWVLVVKMFGVEQPFYGGSNDNWACCGRLLAVEGGWWQMGWLLKAAGGWRECCGRWLVMSGVVVKLFRVRWPLMVMFNGDRAGCGRLLVLKNFIWDLVLQVVI